MTWLQQYRLRHFLRTSFWFVPVACIVLALAVLPLSRWVDRQLDFTWLYFTPDGARAVLGGLSGSMLTFLVFAISALLLVVQLASSQLTPRVITVALGNPLSKIALGVFAFSYTFALGALGRIESHVPQTVVFLAVLGNLASIAFFFWFVQRLAWSLRPVAVLQQVAEEGLRVIDSVYPQRNDLAVGAEMPLRESQPAAARDILYHGRAGSLLAFSVVHLLHLACRADCSIEMAVQVGDFLSPGDPLFRVYPPEKEVDEKTLCRQVVIGPERTMEQDPTFALRIVVDIAMRALSPGINDPTTAVLAIDQIHRLLRHVGARRLDPGVTRDDRGIVRLAYPTPNWEDFVMLAASEIRLAGAGSLQISRRLRAMLEHLIQILPPTREPPLRRQLALVRKSVERHYVDVEDRESADTCDRQGIGGHP
jgi:uncharacterized membrane protein